VRRVAAFVALSALAFAADHSTADPAGKNEKVREAQGKKLVSEICTLCHEIDRVEKQHLSKDEWTGWIKGMIAEGAPVTDEEFSIIVDYLAKNYGVNQ
jgi:competence protein ComEA